MVDSKKVLPIYKIEHGCILSRQGDVTVGFRVRLPEIFTLSDREYEAYHQSWVKAIKLLPANCVFHKQDWFVRGSFQGDFGSIGDSFLSRSSERFFSERECLDHSCYIFLTRRAMERSSLPRCIPIYSERALHRPRPLPGPWWTVSWMQPASLQG